MKRLIFWVADDYTSIKKNRLLPTGQLDLDSFWNGSSVRLVNIAYMVWGTRI